jgi:ribonuclease G
VEKELIINSAASEVAIALLEDGKLVELHNQLNDSQFAVGDIFLGQVKRLMPALNAAFIEIGHNKDAFLHYTDLSPKLQSVAKFTRDTISEKTKTHRLDHFEIEPEIIKTGRIDQVLVKKQPLLVQILKEPIGTKGPRLTCEITIPGRFLVLSPFTDVVAVSKKIANAEERKRLKKVIESIKPRNFGVIVRTAAEGKNSAELHEELSRIMDKWEKMYNQLSKSKPPIKLLSELDKTTSLLRDLVTDSFNRIVVNDKEMYHKIKDYLEANVPGQANIVQFYRSNKPIFDTNGVTRQIKSAFDRTPTMSSGAYIVIEATEAMHVIDVNSGHKMSSKNQEDAVLAVNLEAAEEIARQLRLRDIGGIIIVDFIDMRNPENRKVLQREMKNYMRNDRAQHTILPLSKFGLMQITRQRVRPEVKISTAEVCPSCNGSGKISASILLVDIVERDLNFIMQSRPSSKVSLHVHPYVEAFLKKGFINKPIRWYFEYQKWIRIRANSNYQLMEYRFFDENEDEIRINVEEEVDLEQLEVL